MLRLGLTGFPLGHSLSPVIHQAGMHALGLQGEYRLYPAPPLPAGESCLDSLFRQVKDGELQGLNVTIPHKQTVLRWMDNLSETGRAIGAVNTVYAIEGKLWGDNTDIAGFQHDLGAHLPVKSSSSRALVLGAGGSARAVVFALHKMGWRVTIAARRVSQAEQLLKSLPPVAQAETIQLSAAGLNDTLYNRPEDAPVGLIVNTTPAGMAPNAETLPWPEPVPFPAGAFVYDLVYNPSETRLVRQAQQSGLEACNGLGMLVEQAALSFECWTGLAAPRQVMLAAAIHSQSDLK